MGSLDLIREPRPRVHGILAGSGSAGFSAMEMVVALAIFSVLLLVLVGLQGEFMRFDRQVRLDYLTHPEPSGVLARLRKDTLDSTGYPKAYEEWSQSPSTLLLRVPEKDATHVVVWDFSEAGKAVRREFADGEQVMQWTANGVPEFRVEAFEMPGKGSAVRVTAYDTQGRLAIDQIIQPRA